MESFQVNGRGTGSAQYHPRMMLALLIYCYAHGVFSSRRIERATHRDVGVRYVTANCHPDHDTICAIPGTWIDVRREIGDVRREVSGLRGEMFTLNGRVSHIEGLLSPTPAKPPPAAAGESHQEPDG